MLGTRGRIAGAALVAALGLSGCWLQPRGNAARTGFLPGPQALSSATAGDLAEAWRAGGLGGAVNEPIVNGNWVIVTTATSGVAASYNANNGALRWRQDTEFGPPDPSQPHAMLTDPVWHDDAVQIGVNWQAEFFTGVFTDTGGVALLSPASGAALQPTPPPQLGVPAAVDVWVGADGAVRDQLSTRTNFGLDGTQGDVWYPWAGARAGYVARFNLPMAQAVEVGGNLVWGDDNGPANGWGPTCVPQPNRPGFCAPAWTTPVGGRSAGPTTVGTDAAVYGDDSGRVTVLAAATGEVRWTAELGSAIVGPAAVAGDTIVVGTADGRLAAFAAGGCGAATCAPLWEAPLGAAASSPPLVVGDVALVGTAAGDVVAAALAGCGSATCPPVASIPTGPSAITGGPIYDGGRVLVGTADGQVVALALPA